MMEAQVMGFLRPADFEAAAAASQGLGMGLGLGPGEPLAIGIPVDEFTESHF
jgi:hypothetical protein